MQNNPPSDTGISDSNRIRVGVNGYGTVGKRIADAIAVQPDMKLSGVSKCSSSADICAIRSQGHRLFVPEGHKERIKRDYPAAEIDGSVQDLVESADVIVDATPAGVGEQYEELYGDLQTKAIFQGGEDEAVAPYSFTAGVNYEGVTGSEALRVLSCNSTGLARLLSALSGSHDIDLVTATLVRRGADPDQPARGPINDVVPDPVAVPSHHGTDVQTVLPDIDITTMALRVPTTLMHVQSIAIDLHGRPTTESVVADLEQEPRVRLLENRFDLNDCASIKTMAADAGRPRGDVWENCFWKESITVEGNRLYCLQAIDQRAIVVPENIDAIRALAGDAEATSSMANTNTSLTPQMGMIPPSIDESLESREERTEGSLIEATHDTIRQENPTSEVGQVPVEEENLE
jgi:glyceraldehyde-3-phosphate dehydrogenase (NAD(P))